jgi:hypothetical protein
MNSRRLIMIFPTCFTGAYHDSGCARTVSLPVFAALQESVFVKVSRCGPSQTFPHARRPASGNLQRTKPRERARIERCPRRSLWGFRRGRATAEVSGEGRLSGEDDGAGQARCVLVICGPVCR